MRTKECRVGAIVTHRYSRDCARRGLNVILLGSGSGFRLTDVFLEKLGKCWYVVEVFRVVML